MIYLDNAATTRVSDEVMEAMAPYFQEQYGNAGSLYGFGRQAAEAVMKARWQVADLFNTTPEHIIFTSGGTESNNMVFKGFLPPIYSDHPDIPRNIVVSAIEHDSVLQAARSMESIGYKVSFVQPDQRGVIRVENIIEQFRDPPVLVSVMATNNETGARNDIRYIGEYLRQIGVPFHTDCVQDAAGFWRYDFSKFADFASISSHKIHGPKGVGALYVRDFKGFRPMIHGGPMQEMGLRGGTENVAGIVGFGKAAEIAKRDSDQNIIRASCCKTKLYRLLSERLGDSIHYNGENPEMPGKILNVTFLGVDAETLLLMLDQRGVCVSAGSACHSNTAEPSHVLKAMGLSDEEAKSSIRFSFSGENTLEEIDEAADVIVECVKTLRGYSGKEV